MVIPEKEFPYKSTTITSDKSTRIDTNITTSSWHIICVYNQYCLLPHIPVSLVLLELK